MDARKSSNTKASELLTQYLGAGKQKRSGIDFASAYRALIEGYVELRVAGIAHKAKSSVLSFKRKEK